jgi:hypothetical protein
MGKGKRKDRPNPWEAYMTAYRARKAAAGGPVPFDLRDTVERVRDRWADMKGRTCTARGRRVTIWWYGVVRTGELMALVAPPGGHKADSFWVAAAELECIDGVEPTPDDEFARKMRDDRS